MTKVNEINCVRTFMVDYEGERHGDRVKNKLLVTYSVFEGEVEIDIIWSEAGSDTYEKEISEAIIAVRKHMQGSLTQ